MRSKQESFFSGDAYLSALLCIAASWMCAALVVFSGSRNGQTASEGLLLGVAFIGYVPAGILASLSGRRLAFWELLAATLTVLAAALLYGTFGYWQPSYGTPDEIFASRELDLAKVMNISPGSAYLGPYWVIMLSAFSGFAFLQALVVASLSFMFRAGRVGFEPWFGFEFFLSRRYLQAKRRDARVSVTAGIAALGVALGVAALIAVISTMSGYMAEVKDKIHLTNAHLVLQRFGRDFDDSENIAQKIKPVAGVVASSPFIYTGGMLATEQGMFAVLIKGVDPDQAGTVTSIRQQLKDIDIGVLRPPTPGSLPGIVVGKELMKKLNAKVGDEVSLVSPIAAEGKRGAPPKRMRFRLSGEFASGMNEFDQKLVYIGLDSGQRFIGTEKAVTGLEIKVTDPERVEEVTKRVMTTLGGWPYRTTDWRQMNQSIFSMLKTQKLLMTVMLLFIIVVAAFNVASTLFMLVVEKTREVAVLKAIGAKDGMIMKVFVIEGHIIGAIGVALGVLLGLLVCAGISRLHLHIAADVYLVDTLRVVVEPSEVLFIVLGALEVAHLATLYPALRASRTYPVEAMRYG